MSKPSPLIAFIGPFKRWGGIEGKIVTLAREFLARGVTPELVVIRDGEVPYPDRLPEGVRVTRLETTSKLDGIPAVGRYLRERRPDAVITAKDHSAQVVLLARALFRVHVPVFIKVTNTLSLVARRTVQRWMIRRLYPRAEGIIGNSEGVAQDLVDTFGIEPAGITMIHNPTVTPDFPARSAQPVDHPWFRENRSEAVILGVGRLTRQKDFATLIDAFARLQESVPSRLVILGDGPERQALEARAEAAGIGDRFDLPGFVSDALPFMAKADVFVLSSRYEGLSNVLIEALAVGTPVVTTDCPSGSAEIVGHGRYGRLVPMGDAAAIAEGIRNAIESPPTAALMAEAVERFKSGPVAERYLSTVGLAERVRQPDAAGKSQAPDNTATAVSQTGGEANE